MMMSTSCIIGEPATEERSEHVDSVSEEDMADGWQNVLLEAILPKSELQMPKVFNGFHGSENSAGLIIRCNISKFYDVAMSIRVLLCT